MGTVKLVHSKTRHAYNLAAEKYHELFHNEMSEKAYDRHLLDAFAARFAPGALICDAGCGPSAHIGRYLAEKGLRVVGVDISDRCIEMARALNPDMPFKREDIIKLTFAHNTLEGIVSYYSVIHTPKRSVGRIFQEFHRILKPGGSLLVAVKAGSHEGFSPELIGIAAQIYVSFFDEKEVAGYFEKAGFRVEFLERRNPYDFEIRNERIFAIGRKPMTRGKGHP